MDCMQAVSLRRCAKLTDAGIAELALAGTLRSLCVAGVPRMGPAAMQALAASCRRGPEFFLIYCASVSGHGSRLHVCPALTVPSRCQERREAICHWALLRMTLACAQGQPGGAGCVLVSRGARGLAGLAHRCVLQPAAGCAFWLQPGAAVLSFPGNSCRRVSTQEAVSLSADLHTLFCGEQVTTKFLHGHSREHLLVQGAAVQKCPSPATARAVLMLPEM